MSQFHPKIVALIVMAKCWAATRSRAPSFIGHKNCSEHSLYPQQMTSKIGSHGRAQLLFAAAPLLEETCQPASSPSSSVHSPYCFPTCAHKETTHIRPTPLPARETPPHQPPSSSLPCTYSTRCEATILSHLNFTRNITVTVTPMTMAAICVQRPCNCYREKIVGLQ